MSNFYLKIKQGRTRPHTMSMIIHSIGQSQLYRLQHGNLSEGAGRTNRQLPTGNQHHTGEWEVWINHDGTAIHLSTNHDPNIYGRDLIYIFGRNTGVGKSAVVKMALVEGFLLLNN